MDHSVAFAKVGVNEVVRIKGPVTRRLGSFQPIFDSTGDGHSMATQCVNKPLALLTKFSADQILVHDPAEEKDWR